MKAILLWCPNLLLISQRYYSELFNTYNVATH